MMKPEHVYVVMEIIDGEPVILTYHRRRNCPSLREQLTDPDIARLRAVARYPDRIQALLSGRFLPNRSAPEVVELQCTPQDGEFLDDAGNRHIIFPCKACGFAATTEEEP